MTERSTDFVNISLFLNLKWFKKTMTMETKNSSTKCIILILSSIYSPKKFSVDHEHPNTTLEYIDSDFNEISYMLNIYMPIVVGLFVALILGWMLIRYKMSSHMRSNYNGSIYCCPQKCFDFCAKFFECKRRCPKIFKLKKSSKSYINYRLANKLVTFNESDKTNAVQKVRTEQAKRTSIDHVSNGSITTTGLKSNLNNNSNSTSSSLRSQNNSLNPNQQHLPFSFLTRDSFSSRRDSAVQIPDLIKSNNFSMNWFHSFQSKNTSLFS